MTSETFGVRLKRLLKEKGWKQRDLVNSTGFSKEKVSMWCNDVNLPNSEALVTLADKLNVSESYLMGISTQKTDDREKLELGYQVCDLFQKCYGKDAYKAVYNFLQLDEIDRNTIISNINFLLSAEKYTKKESLNA